MGFHDFHQKIDAMEDCSERMERLTEQAFDLSHISQSLRERGCRTVEVDNKLSEVQAALDDLRDRKKYSGEAFK